MLFIQVLNLEKSFCSSSNSLYEFCITWQYSDSIEQTPAFVTRFRVSFCHANPNSLANLAAQNVWLSLINKIWVSIQYRPVLQLNFFHSVQGLNFLLLGHSINGGQYAFHKFCGILLSHIEALDPRYVSVLIHYFGCGILTCDSRFNFSSLESQSIHVHFRNEAAFDFCSWPKFCVKEEKNARYRQSGSSWILKDIKVCCSFGYSNNGSRFFDFLLFIITQQSLFLTDNNLSTLLYFSCTCYPLMYLLQSTTLHLLKLWPRRFSL